MKKEAKFKLQQAVIEKRAKLKEGELSKVDPTDIYDTLCFEDDSLADEEFVMHCEALLQRKE